MRTMSFMALAAASVSIAAALAQQPGPPRGPLPMKPDFARALSISPEKAGQVEAILAAEREQHHAVHEKARAELSKVLTAQQLAALEDFMRAGPGPARDARPGEGPARERGPRQGPS